MINGQKYHRFNNPTLTQGGWQRTGEGDNYIERITEVSNPSYYTRIATIEYIPDVTTNKIKIFAYENIGLPMDVSVLVLRNDNYILESLSWKENGGVFSINTNYDKLGIMFRYQNSSAIRPDNITGIRITNWFDTPIPTRKLHNKTDIITSLPADLYADGTNATVGLVGNMSQTGTPTPTTPIQPSECGERTEERFKSYDNIINDMQEVVKELKG